MCHRKTFHRPVDLLDFTLLFAPLDDEPDTDDEDGGLTEAREELARGEGISTDQLLVDLGLEPEETTP